MSCKITYFIEESIKKERQRSIVGNKRALSITYFIESYVILQMPVFLLFLCLTYKIALHFKKSVSVFFLI